MVGGHCAEIYWRGALKDTRFLSLSFKTDVLLVNAT